MTPPTDTAAPAAGRGRPRAGDPRRRPSTCWRTSATTGSPWTPWPPRAKASKATLYRRWNGKVSLVIDALHHDHQKRRAEHARHRHAARRPDRDVLRHGRPDRQARGRSRSAASSPRSPATPTSPRPSAASSSAPRSPVVRGDLRARPGARRDPRGRRPRPARAGAGRHRPAPPLPHGRAAHRGPRSPSVIDQIILPAATRGTPRPDPAHLRETDLMTDTTDRSRRGGAEHQAASKHLGWALVLISVAQLMVVLDGTIVNIALPYIQARPRHLAAPT